MKVDIIIPVFNNLIGTKKCIDSIYHHIPNVLNTLFVYDDVSKEETREMLKSLDYPNLNIHFAETNIGYGHAVNKSFEKTTTDFVLILNSDTVILDDFLTPMIETMLNNKDLGILNANGDQYNRTPLENYDTTKGFLESYNFSGYAFLIRRELFEKEKGFNSIYGKGYFEDAELGRRAVLQGYKMGLHVDSYILHEHQGSFKKVVGVNELYENNKKRFFERYPKSLDRIIYLANKKSWLEEDSKVKDFLTETLKDGGKVFWLSKLNNDKMPFLELKQYPMNFHSFFKLIRLSRKKKHLNIKLLINKDISLITKIIYRIIAKFFKVEEVCLEKQENIK